MIWISQICTFIDNDKWWLKPSIFQFIGAVQWVLQMLIFTLTWFYEKKQKSSELNSSTFHTFVLFPTESHAQYIWKINIYIFQLNKLAQNLRLAAFIFVALVWRSYWCFSLTHLSLTYHTAMEDWAKLAATRHTSSPHTGALPEQQAAREVRRQNPTC